MGTVTRSEINGVIDTGQNVLDNISTLATAAGCFVAWDNDTGQWNIILNDTGSSSYSFDDSNIIGEISVSSSSVNELYNSATIQFPHKDLRDSVDIITVKIDSADRYPQELDNNLEIKLDCINDPVQAQLIATRELKQSRVDKIIRFVSNFSANGLKAGDLIDITSSPYGFTNKIFRIIQIEEEDSDEGNILFAITALEYDADVYSTSGLSYETRTKRTGIIPKINNEATALKDDINIGSQIGRLLGANLLLGLLNNDSNGLGGLLKNIFGVDPDTGEISSRGEFNDPDKQAAVESIAKPVGAALTVTKSANDICNSSTVTFSINHNCSNCFFDNPEFTYDYEITGILENECDIPLEGTITTTGTNITNLTARISHSERTVQTITFTVGGVSVSVNVHPLIYQYVEEVVATSSTITEGDTVSVTVNTVGYIDGSTLPYTISGSAASKVSSPALTGTVTLNSDTASLSIVTTDDSAYNTAENLIVTIGTAANNPCVISSNSTTITVNNNDTTGPITPDIPKPGDVSCQYVQVPVVWCGTFDADTQYLKSISVRKYAYLPLAPVGGTAVPTSVTVNNAGTSSASLTIGSTVNVDTVTGAGGAQIDVITSFGPLPSGGDTLITGTTSTFNGYW